MPKVLFILKHRNVYGDTWSRAEEMAVSQDPEKSLSSGLLNSARFIVVMLNREGIEARLVQVRDNNCIDREVHEYRPDVVVIEALWVVPEKFEVLRRLHPYVQWVVRGHSEIPFLAQEGVAIDWITRYVQFDSVCFAANSESSMRDIRTIVAAANPDWTDSVVDSKVILLPNYYPYDCKRFPRKPADGFLDVACLGAIRPLKNQLIQAVAAIKFAECVDKDLRFHINSTRVEQRGGNILKNLRSLFAAAGQELVEHEWLDRKEMLDLLRGCDVGMQMSFSETFNIVAADMIRVGLPLVVSPVIKWVSHFAMADPVDSDDMVLKLKRVCEPIVGSLISTLNASGLRRHCEKARRTWLKYVTES